MICYWCCQSGHSGRFFKRTQLYADRVAKAKGCHNANLKRKFDDMAKRHEFTGNQLRDSQHLLECARRDTQYYKEKAQEEKRKSDDQINDLKRELPAAQDNSKDAVAVDVSNFSQGVSAGHISPGLSSAANTAVNTA